MRRQPQCEVCGNFVSRTKPHICAEWEAVFDPHRMVEDIIQWHSASAYPRDRAMAARLAVQRRAA